MARSVSYVSGGKTITAELFEPATPPATPTGVVVVAYGTDGLVDNENRPWKTMIEGYARALADDGFVALIPDYLARTGTAPGLPVLAALGTLRDQWQAALADAVDFAAGLTSVNAARVGLLGFSLGGHLCLRVRSKGKVLAAYFSPLLDDGIGTGGKLSHAQVHQGEADEIPGINTTTAASIKATLDGEGTATDLFTYPGAGHGFVGSDANNTAARSQSQTRTRDLFRNHL
jgi:dienelactone hydrolase